MTETRENLIPRMVSLSSEVAPVERLAFERLLADLSAEFANISGEQLASGIQDAMKQIREFLGFDRSSFGIIEMSLAGDRRS